MLTHRLWRHLILLAAGLFLGGLLLGGLLMAGTAFTHATTPPLGGAAKAAAAQCSQATFKGTYVFAVNGGQIVGSDRVPFAYAGLLTSDGSSHLQGIISQSVNGQISRHISFTGTYTVKPDCTATETVKDVSGPILHFDDSFTPDGSLLSFVQTDPGSVLSGVASRGTGK